MMDDNYAKVDPVDVAKAQTHLSSSQQNDLRIKLLSKYDALLDGILGRYRHQKLHLTLQEGAIPVPVHHKAFPAPHAHYIQKHSKKNYNAFLIWSIGTSLSY
jgi:hypothetical protein